MYVAKAPIPPVVLYKAAATVDVHLRSGPVTGYASLIVLKKGTIVNVIGKSGSWLKVTYNGKTGYAYADYFLRLNIEFFMRRHNHCLLMFYPVS
jgi:Uncharacterized protein with a bacterial SH3 domain homologue